MCQYFYLTRLLGADEPMDEKVPQRPRQLSLTLSSQYGFDGRSSLNFVSAEKLRHDIEQFQYLISEGKVSVGIKW